MDARENILLIRLKSIGDVLFTLPAVHRVRENFPGAKIAFLTSRENAPLLEGFREADEIITVDRARLQGGNPFAITAEVFSLLRRLRRPKFSLVVDFQGYGETAWLARLSGAPQRWGSVYAPGRCWAYTRGVTRNDRLHHTDRYLSLLAQCGLRPGKILNEFVLPDGALNEARQFFAAHNLNAAKPTLFIQPFTSSPQRNWPLDRQLAIARHWWQRGLQILFGGGPADRAALEPVRQAGFPVSAGAPLLVSAGLMKLSSLILGGDTGALHLAVALDKRVVMLVHTDKPGNSYPFQHPDWVITPTTGGNIAGIETRAVIEACDRAFAEVQASVDVA
jgi:ADP-heptose:LPS heptosyltransferase